MPDEKLSSDIRVPRQQRSRERVESILEAAKVLIGEKGSASLKIQEIAEGAGVTAGSMYQYFPNKGAILRALAQQYLDQFHGLLKATLTIPPETLQECQESLSSLLDQFYKVNCQDPVLRDVWLSISADKAMREMDARSSQRNAAILFDTFKHLFPELHWPGLQRYFLLVVYITPPSIRLALSADPKESLEFIETAKRMINTSLASWAAEQT
jgi:AcrR family transcriptional regulator